MPPNKPDTGFRKIHVPLPLKEAEGSRAAAEDMVDQLNLRGDIATSGGQHN
jgi:hypothetical protein